MGKSAKETQIFGTDTEKDFVQKLDLYERKCFEETKRVYHCRNNAAMRLIKDEFWIQNISIYYSVFTALLSVLSIVDNSDFLKVPSVLFTVSVAILVTYANAQKCWSRANDLYSNCNDLGKIHTEVTKAIVSNMKKDASSKDKDKEQEYSALKGIMTDYYSRLGDSESHDETDEWKYTKSKMRWIHGLFKFIFVAFLFAIPVIFVIMNISGFSDMLNFKLPNFKIK